MGDVWRQDDEGLTGQGRGRASYRVQATPSPLSQTSFTKPRARTERYNNDIEYQ